MNFKVELSARNKPANVSNQSINTINESIQSTLLIEKPNVRWEDVVGLEQAKNTLREAVLLPIKFPQMFVGIRTPWKGILLYGV